MSNSIVLPMRRHFSVLYRVYKSNRSVSCCTLKRNTSHETKHSVDQQNVLHRPVMVDEVINLMKPDDKKTYIDMTFGAGGHSKAILDCAPNAKIFGLDRDPVAHELAVGFSKENSQVIPLLGKFSELNMLLSNEGFGENSIDGILIDAGASSMQFDSAERGFSLSMDSPLDMRMDGNRYPDQPSAADVVNHLDEVGLYNIIKKYGEEKRARMIARAIVDSRYAFGKITTTRQLADIVGGVFEESFVRDKLMRQSHVATKTFQALRIFVNNELNELYNGLEIALKVLKPKGVCVCISFHSLEDRIVKRHFHGINMDANPNMSIVDLHRNSMKIHSQDEVEKLLLKHWVVHDKKVTLPSENEITLNPRSRSAKLRAAFKK